MRAKTHHHACARGAGIKREYTPTPLYRTPGPKERKTKCKIEPAKAVKGSRLKLAVGGREPASSRARGSPRARVAGKAPAPPRRAHAPSPPFDPRAPPSTGAPTFHARPAAARGRGPRRRIYVTEARRPPSRTRGARVPSHRCRGVGPSPTGRTARRGPTAAERTGADSRSRGPLPGR